uniref:Ricin B-type lectin domain-containing protein n=1 Tax=Panagrellus redivivus TaxID=6233 RepID=A0A7E4ZWM0_PANRE
MCHEFDTNAGPQAVSMTVECKRNCQPQANFFDWRFLDSDILPNSDYDPSDDGTKLLNPSIDLLKRTTVNDNGPAAHRVDFDCYEDASNPTC